MYIDWYLRRNLYFSYKIYFVLIFYLLMIPQCSNAQFKTHNYTEGPSKS